MFKILWALGLTIVSSIGPIVPFVQAQVLENFSDGDHTADPLWSGEADRFIVQENELRLAAAQEAGTAFLATPSEVVIGTWEFRIRLEFNPSGANFARVYLVSDQQDLRESLNGYYVVVGGPNDEVSLFRQDGTSHVEIIDGDDDVTDLAVVELNVRVTRSGVGEWILYTAAEGTDFMLQGSVIDQTHRTGTFFGIFCEFTTTRSDKFYFDDLVVEGTSTEPPAEVDVARHKEIIFSEFMADPTPVIGLPESEFVELFNRGSTAFNLSDYTLSDGTSTSSLPFREILPGEYVVLTDAEATDQFSAFTTAVGLDGFPSINNSGDVLILRDGEGSIVDSLNFNDQWYVDSHKKGGGWTIEIIDPSNVCGDEKNWTASRAEAGGTPGLQNSVFANKPDTEGPTLIAALPIDDLRIKLDFDEPLLLEPVLPGQVSVVPETLVSDVEFFDPALRALIATLGEPLMKGTAYEVSVSAVRDCNKNLSGDGEPIVFALPEEPDSLDVVINEILFNAASGGADFVELFNRSSKYFSLADWQIGHWVAESIEDEQTITPEDVLLAPQGYAVITADAGDLLTRYASADAAAIISGELPSMPDDAGTVAIADGRGRVLDAFLYDETYHSELVVDVEGISLERLSPDVATGDIQNWNSASADVGFATPGRKNSNSIIEVGASGEPVSITPEVFQPVHGSPNFATIAYRFDSPGNTGTVRIVDSMGRTVREIAVNAPLGTSGFFRWDGDRDDGSQARIGYYVVWFEIFNLDGTVQRFRKRVVIAAPF